jgi:hypothetical protein
LGVFAAGGVLTGVVLTSGFGVGSVSPVEGVGTVEVVEFPISVLLSSPEPISTVVEFEELLSNTVSGVLNGVGETLGRGVGVGVVAIPPA